MSRYSTLPVRSLSALLLAATVDVVAPSPVQATSTASITPVASYGFIVVTPNHRRLNFFDTNYYTSTSQIGETLTWMASENGRAASPLEGHIDTDTMVLLGHSFGGATGLSIAEDKCSIPFCTTLSFNLPSAVKAGSFYGTNNAILGIYPTIDNQIPVQLVQGQSDGMAEPAQAESSYGKIANGHKQIVRVTGASHYGITNTQNPSGAQAEANSQTSTQSAAASPRGGSPSLS